MEQENKNVWSSTLRGGSRGGPGWARPTLVLEKNIFYIKLLIRLNKNNNLAARVIITRAIITVVTADSWFDCEVFLNFNLWKPSMSKQLNDCRREVREPGIDYLFSIFHQLFYVNNYITCQVNYYLPYITSGNIRQVI